jgi:hypothetical protein
MDKFILVPERVKEIWPKMELGKLLNVEDGEEGVESGRLCSNKVSPLPITEPG